MKKTATMLCASLLLTIGFLSCGKETQSTTQGGGTFVIKATVTPPLQFGKSSAQIPQINIFQLWGSGFLSKWDGNSNSTNLSEIVTDEISVTSGQNLSCFLHITNQYDFVCRTIKLEGIQNGKVIKTYTLSMGFKSSSADMCTDGYQNQKTFIIQ